MRPRSTRYCVVSHPYDPNGRESNAYEVLPVFEDGTLGSGRSFEMGRAQHSIIAFTPDGHVGIAAQEGGSLGVFRLDEAGVPTVVHRSFQGSFFASAVLMAPGGEHAWVVDSQWAVHGGGIYAIRIHTDGTLEDEGRVVEAKLPYALSLLPEPARTGPASEAWALGSYDVLGSPEGFGLHLVSLGDSPARLVSADPFEDHKAIISAMAITSDGRQALVGDNNGYADIPNRISVVSLDGIKLRPVQAITPILDPVAIVASPFGGPVLVASGFGNAIYILDYDPRDARAPFSFRGELSYAGKRPELPACALCIEDGELAGRVLITENTGIRSVDFLSDGKGPLDRGVHELATGAGALGVQPALDIPTSHP